MDKFVRILANQNPKIEIDCQNPDCKRKSKVKTIDLFSAKSYAFICPYCGKTTEINVDIQLDKIKKEFKKLGITW